MPGRVPNKAALPVTLVFKKTWTEARAYCEAVRMRLPTEAEWEYAIRPPSFIFSPAGSPHDHQPLHPPGAPNPERGGPAVAPAAATPYLTRGATQELMAHIDIVFDGPPGRDSCRFVEVEDERGHSINAGEWVQRPDGWWVLRLKADDVRRQARPRAD